MYKFWGKVKKGSQRGKKLGFPTANINLFKNIQDGIYISKTKIGNTHYKSLTFIGASKTFNETKIHAETYILDFGKNIYNEWISIVLLKKIRQNIKFSSVTDLVKQMRKDENKARVYFKLNPSP